MIQLCDSFMIKHLCLYGEDESALLYDSQSMLVICCWSNVHLCCMYCIRLGACTLDFIVCEMLLSMIHPVCVIVIGDSLCGCMGSFIGREWVMSARVSAMSLFFVHV